MIRILEFLFFKPCCLSNLKNACDHRDPSKEKSGFTHKV